MSEDLVEKIRAGMFPHVGGDNDIATELARDALKAIEASGTHVVVPLVPTKAMADAGTEMMTALMRGQLPGFDPVWLRAWRALLDARHRPTGGDDAP